ARALYALEDRLGQKRMDRLLQHIVSRYGYGRIDTEGFVAEAAAAGGPPQLGRWLAAPGARDPALQPPRRGVPLYGLGPFPVLHAYSVGVLPVFSGVGRDELAAGLRLAGGTPWALRGFYAPFLDAPGWGFAAEALRRLHGGHMAYVLSGIRAWRQQAIELR